MNQNAQIEDYLTYYIGVNDPQYAVMLKGAWGSGKTWFIKKYIADHPPAQKHLYLSLYGVSNTREIDDEIAMLLHPVWNHKFTKVAAKVAKALLRVGLKLDLDGDGKSDVSLNSSIPDIDINQLLKNAEQLILVFDDLERCEMPLAQVMGYINHFVEHGGCRVILLANEDEIIAKEEKMQASASTGASIPSREEVHYLRIREKLVGKTFEVWPHIQGALDAFLNELRDEAAKKILVDNMSFVIELYGASGYQNLRHLRQAILDFERIVRATDADKRDPEMLKSILGTFLISTFELRSGNLQPEDIAILHDAWLAFAQDKHREKYNALREKYPMLARLDSVFSGELWKSIFTTGLIDDKAVKDAIKESKYYAEEAQRPDWLRLWNAFEMDDAPLAELLQEVQERLKAREYAMLGELMHISGALFSLACIGVYDVQPKQVLDWAISNAEAIRDRGHWLTEEDPLILTKTGWNGRLFHGKDEPEFTALSKRIDELQSDIDKASLSSAAQQLLELVRSNPDGFWRRMSLNAGGQLRLARKPVLTLIDPGEFADAVLKLQASSLVKISYVFRSRYKDHAWRLVSERPWLETVACRLEPYKGVKGKMSSFYVGVVYGDLVSAAKALAIDVGGVTDEAT